MLNQHNLNIAKLASKEESRFTLSGILISPSCTVATDGHKLIKMDTPEMPKEDQIPLVGGMTPLRDWKPFVLGVKDCLELAKAIPEKAPIPVIRNAFVLERSDERVKIGVTRLGEDYRIFDFAILKGNFPDYERVMPRQEYPFTIGFDINYLKEISTVLGRTMDRGRQINLHLKNNTAAAMFTMETEHDQRVLALLMPMRAGEPQDIPGMATEDAPAYPATEAVIREIADHIVHDILVQLALRGKDSDAEELVNLTAKRLKGNDSSYLPPWVQAAELSTKVIQ